MSTVFCKKWNKHFDLKDWFHWKLVCQDCLGEDCVEYLMGKNYKEGEYDGGRAVSSEDLASAPRPVRIWHNRSNGGDNPDQKSLP